MRTVQVLTAGCALVGTLALAGCGSSSPPASSASSSSSASSMTSASAATGSDQVVRTATSSAGTYLANSSGRALYVFAADTPGHSNCTASCLTYWPLEPAPATTPSSPAGVTATLGVLTRPDGTKQLTVDGLPAYTYTGDTSPGMTAGQGVNASGGLWWLIRPDGHALTASSSSSSSSASPTSSGRSY